jgi:hypothetical protein
MHSRSIVGFVRSVSSDRLNGVSVIGRQLPPGGGSNRSDVAGWPKELSVPTSFHRSAGELGLLSSYPGQMSRRTEWSHVKAQIPSKRAFHPRRAAGDARRLRHSSFGRRENSTLWPKRKKVYNCLENVLKWQCTIRYLLRIKLFAA